MNKIITKLKELGFTNARAVSENEIAGVSIAGFEARGLCPFTDLPQIEGFWIDWQTPSLLIVGAE